MREFFNWFFGPTGKFGVGDSVQPVSGERELMVVVKVKFGEGSGDPRLLCQWTDSKTNENREHLFTENELAPFDWNRKMNRAPGKEVQKDQPDSSGSAN